MESIDRGLPIFAQLLYDLVSKLIAAMFVSLTKLIIKVMLVRDLNDTVIPVVALIG